MWVVYHKNSKERGELAEFFLVAALLRVKIHLFVFRVLCVSENGVGQNTFAFVACGSGTGGRGHGDLLLRDAQRA